MSVWFFFQSQAKSIAEQKRFPFATDNDSTNEELGEAESGEVPVACASRLQVDAEQAGRMVRQEGPRDLQRRAVFA